MYYILTLPIFDFLDDLVVDFAMASLIVAVTIWVAL